MVTTITIKDFRSLYERLLNEKIDIIKREEKLGLINYPAIFLGDSKIDYLVAKYLNYDFYHVHK